ncbi:hypothetical protein M422DRAFT_54687 [Sphaerobolus stellatus SS14]|uniref:Peptidase A1 domain-containing protein n=1 Tax=Sphaerobolus stellatus (strain SS14) TaxID=990650 RepID=A0A0C9UGY0_SPHS4|nr:hypothetical protein M422DRAFT_54687 [Sphaerobolus stellatus SS14]
MFIHVGADGGWLRLPIYRTPDIDTEEGLLAAYRVSNIFIGTPQAMTTLSLDLWNEDTQIQLENCVYCQGDVFNPELSSSFRTFPGQLRKYGKIAGLGKDTISFGGKITLDDTPFQVIKHRIPRTATEDGGTLGIYVDPTNETARENHVLSRMYRNGVLLSPVVGILLDNNASHITIGALDHNDYAGEVNWIETYTDPDKEMASPIHFPLDGLTIVGGNISFLTPESSIYLINGSISSSLSVPIPLYLDLLRISEPPVTDFGTVSSLCNRDDGISSYTDGLAKFNFTAVINGINYSLPALELTGDCNVQTAQPFLGLDFLESLFVAYRFPTSECPTPYYGLAFKKGQNDTSEKLNQKPRLALTSSTQCLTFETPTSVLSISTGVPQQSILYHGSYPVMGDTEKKVPLAFPERFTPQAWSTPTASVVN